MRSPRNMTAVAAVLAVVLSSAGCAVQAQSTAAVRTASPFEVQAVHAKGQPVLPAGAQDAQFDDRQAVSVDGSPRLIVLPVRFKTPLKDPAVEGQMLTQCGVVVTPQAGASVFVLTLGAGNTEMMTCAGIKAVGGTVATTRDSRPDLILIYDAYTGRDSFPATILLTWNAKSGAYNVDDALSQWLGEHKEGRTVAGARRLLAKKRQESKSNS